jgi:hypothetical protein
MPDPTPFATPADVVARLGRALTTAEDDEVEALIEGATGLIAEAAGKDDAWADAYTPPRVIKALTVTMTLRAMTNPEGIQSRTESLGQYSETTRFAENSDDVGASGLYITEGEERMVRRIVNGGDSGTATMGSLLDDIPEWVTQPPTTWIGSMTGDDG